MNLASFFKKSQKEEYKNSFSQKSMEWMKERTQKISQDIVESKSIKTESRAQWGNIYQFVYRAKHRNKLKYYDAFPMMIVLERYSDGFLGINLHYLPPTLRFVLMDQLWKFVSSPTGELDEDTQFLLRYNMLKSLSGRKLYKPCIKRYLNKQIRSPLYKIPADKWNLAMILPSSRFLSKDNSIVLDKIVHFDSKRIINN